MKGFRRPRLIENAALAPSISIERFPAPNPSDANAVGRIFPRSVLLPPPCSTLPWLDVEDKAPLWNSVKSYSALCPAKIEIYIHNKKRLQNLSPEDHKLKFLAVSVVHRDYDIHRSRYVLWNQLIQGGMLRNWNIIICTIISFIPHSFGIQVYQTTALPSCGRDLFHRHINAFCWDHWPLWE